MKLRWIVKLVSTAVLGMGIAAVASAQSAGPTGGSLTPGKSARQGQHHPILDALAKLDLTPDQKTKIKALVKTRDDDVKEFRKAHKGDQAAIRTYAEEATKTLVVGVKGVLTPAQWDQFQQALKAMRGNRQGAGPGTGAGATPPSKS